LETPNHWLQLTVEITKARDFTHRREGTKPTKVIPSETSYLERLGWWKIPPQYRNIFCLAEWNIPLSRRDLS
jgi:hypothetical protein